jgi:hypothetical protein
VIDNITPDTETVVRELGLEDDQTALLAISEAKPETPETPTEPELTATQIETAKVIAAMKKNNRLVRLARLNKTPNPPPTPAQIAANKATAERISIKPGVMSLGIVFGGNSIIHLPREVWLTHARKIIAVANEKPPVNEKPCRLTDSITSDELAWINAGETETARRLKSRLDKDMSQFIHNKYMAMLREESVPAPVTTASSKTASAVEPAAAEAATLSKLAANVSAKKAANATKGKGVRLADVDLSDDQIKWINSAKGKLAKSLKTMLAKGTDMTEKELRDTIEAMRTAMQAVVVNAKPAKAAKHGPLSIEEVDKLIARLPKVEPLTKLNLRPSHHVSSRDNAPLPN